METPPKAPIKVPFKEPQTKVGTLISRRILPPSRPITEIKTGQLLPSTSTGKMPELSEKISELPGPLSEEQAGLPLSDPSQFKKSIQPIQPRIRNPEVDISDISRFEVNLMPVRCYACGEVIRQLAIEDLLRSEKSLKEVLDELNYYSLCCRNLIRSQVSVLEIEKKKEIEKKIKATPITSKTTFPLSSYSLAPGRSIEEIKVIDEIPPGETSILKGAEVKNFPAEIPTELYTEPVFEEYSYSSEDAYQHFMKQIQSELKEETD